MMAVTRWSTLVLLGSGPVRPLGRVGMATRWGSRGGGRRLAGGFQQVAAGPDGPDHEPDLGGGDGAAGRGRRAHCGRGPSGQPACQGLRLTTAPYRSSNRLVILASTGGTTPRRRHGGRRRLRRGCGPDDPRCGGAERQGVDPGTHILLRRRDGSSPRARPRRRAAQCCLPRGAAGAAPPARPVRVLDSLGQRTSATSTWATVRRRGFAHVSAT